LSRRFQLDFRNFPEESYERLRHLAYLRGTNIHAFCRETLMAVAAGNVAADLVEADQCPPEFEPQETPGPWGPGSVKVVETIIREKPPWER
jgi:hypothetical protein